MNTRLSLILGHVARRSNREETTGERLAAIKSLSAELAACGPIAADGLIVNAYSVSPTSLALVCASGNTFYVSHNGALASQPATRRQLPAFLITWLNTPQSRVDLDAIPFTL